MYLNRAYYLLLTIWDTNILAHDYMSTVIQRTLLERCEDVLLHRGLWLNIQICAMLDISTLSN